MFSWAQKYKIKPFFIYFKMSKFLGVTNLPPLKWISSSRLTVYKQTTMDMILSNHLLFLKLFLPLNTNPIALANPISLVK
jgi:hypothetical protein